MSHVWRAILRYPGRLTRGGKGHGRQSLQQWVTIQLPSI